MDQKLELVFATQNLNKVKEIQTLVPQNIKLLSLDDIGCTEDIPETSHTIEGNALQKSRYVMKKYGYSCFADDTGLEVDALNGAPGVYSARYAGKSKNDDANLEKLLMALEGKNNRNARFVTVISLLLKDREMLFTGICTGSITRSKKGNSGFGYDPVFLPSGFSKTFAEMALDQKSRLSHRGKAVQKLVEYLLK